MIDMAPAVEHTLLSSGGDGLDDIDLEAFSAPGDPAPAPTSAGVYMWSDDDLGRRVVYCRRGLHFDHVARSSPLRPAPRRRATSSQWPHVWHADCMHGDCNPMSHPIHVASVEGYDGAVGTIRFYGNHLEKHTVRLGVVFATPIGLNNGTVSPRNPGTLAVCSFVRGAPPHRARALFISLLSLSLSHRAFSFLILYVDPPQNVHTTWDLDLGAFGLRPQMGAT